MMRSPREIAIDILNEWENINTLGPAYGCLQEMLEINDITVEGDSPPYRGHKNVILNFLGCCRTFRTADDTATNLKNELREIVDFKKVRKRQSKIKD